MMWSTYLLHLYNVLGVQDVLCQIETMQFVIWIIVVYISIKPPFVGEHAFPLTGFVGLVAAVG